MALVIDLTRLSAAYGPRLLAETGHRIIRVEPAHGDDVRRAPPFLDAQVTLEHGAFHQYLNAGKESVTIDLETADGGKILRELVQKANCVVLTTPIHYDAAWFFEANPEICVVEVDDVENELCEFARAGLLSITGQPGQRPTILGGHVIFSIIGLYTAIAASSALTCARLTGNQQHVRVSSKQCFESMAEQGVLAFHTTGMITERRGCLGAITAVSGALPCADGYWMVSVPHERRSWTQLMNWMNDPVLQADPSLMDEPAREQRRDLIFERLIAWSGRTKQKDLVLEAQGHHIPAAPVATTLDLAGDPQLVARGFLQELDHPMFGKIFFPMGATAAMSGVRLSPAPRLGEHNAAVLHELGYSQADAQAMLESRIL